MRLPVTRLALGSKKDASRRLPKHTEDAGFSFLGELRSRYTPEPTGTGLSVGNESAGSGAGGAGAEMRMAGAEVRLAEGSGGTGSSLNGSPASGAGGSGGTAGPEGSVRGGAVLPPPVEQCVQEHGFFTGAQLVQLQLCFFFPQLKIDFFCLVQVEQESQLLVLQELQPFLLQAAQSS